MGLKCDPTISRSVSLHAKMPGQPIKAKPSFNFRRWKEVHSAHYSHRCAPWPDLIDPTANGTIAHDRSHCVVGKTMPVRDVHLQHATTPAGQSQSSHKSNLTIGGMCSDPESSPEKWLSHRRSWDKSRRPTGRKKMVLNQLADVF